MNEGETVHVQWNERFVANTKVTFYKDEILFIAINKFKGFPKLLEYVLNV